MRLLHVLATFDPAAGGPVEGVRQCALALGKLGHVVEIATLDAPDAPFLSDVPAPVKALGPGRARYGLAPRAPSWLREHAPRFDAVIVHGLWQYHGFATRQALRGLPVPYYVFAHGMLDPWFKHTFPLKHLKKWLYWPWAEYRVLRDARAVLFTTEEERLLARQSFWLYRVRERVVSYGTVEPQDDPASLRAAFFSAYPALASRRLLLFLGRIHPKKGCDILLRAFARVAPSEPLLHLVIAGTGNDETVARLHALALELNIADRITWTGLLQGDLKWGAFCASDAFVLPSHQENFGIAVVEALASGMPALISDKINIWREVDADGAGLVASDTVEGTAMNLRRWLALDASSRMHMRERAHAAFIARFTIDAHIRKLLQTLEDDRVEQARSEKAATRVHLV
ncbi:glycosyltransferase [Trinickia dinghuensis]|uniref:Glycosyltransferase n=1 Tax=Trinickia dinghuensis TaxID=2291023 RepID=A0A3D8JUC6_9BURK|nr:glycosyltransferase [Trinickia dinghuensis]RDU95991.1 glycosyltransferase [Trinickia dinghuensis]